MNHQRAAPIGTAPDSAVATTPVRFSFRFVPARWHGALDYGAAVALLVAPAVLGLRPGAFGLSIAAGALLIAYSLVTDYALSVAKWISLRAHLALDVSAGLVLLTAPVFLGLDGIDRAYLITMAAGVFMAVAVTQNQQA